MKLSFIIPCYGSEHTLANVIAELDSVMAQRPEHDYEIILTDDQKTRCITVQSELIAACEKRIKKAEKGGHYSAYVSSGYTGHEGGDLLVRETLDRINKKF